MTVNDLTSMVKKKKKNVPDGQGAFMAAPEPLEALPPSEKRKAEGDSSQTPPGKKTKLDEA